MSRMRAWIAGPVLAMACGGGKGAAGETVVPSAALPAHSPLTLAYTTTLSISLPRGLLVIRLENLGSKDFALYGVRVE